jgi:hypothetical protein
MRPILPLAPLVRAVRAGGLHHEPGGKDRYNRTAPTGDAAFTTYAQNPQVAFLINSLVLGDPTGQSPIVTTGCHDLAARVRIIADARAA